MIVGFLQYAPQERSAERNLDYIIDRTQNLSDALIVLPELFLGSYTKFSTVDQSALLQLLDPIIKHSNQRNLAFVGSLPVKTNNRVFNRSIFINQGTISEHYDKRNLFGGEQRLFSPGNLLYQIFEFCYLKFAVQICFDNVNPVAANEATKLHGIDLLLAPSSVSVDFISSILKARSLENQIITVFCNRTGFDDGNYYSGGSSIFFPDGRQIEASTPEVLELTELSQYELVHLSSKRQSFLESTSNVTKSNFYNKRAAANIISKAAGVHTGNSDPQGQFTWWDE